MRPKSVVVWFGSVSLLAVLVACVQRDTDRRDSGRPDSAGRGSPVASHQDGTCDQPAVEGLTQSSRLPERYSRMRSIRLALIQESQRFADSPAGLYGPIACIIPVDELLALGNAQFDTPSGAVVAFLWVSDTTSMRAYTDLHLGGGGVHCLILKGNTNQATMTAHVVRSSPAGCDAPTASTSLTARPLTLGSTSSADYPPVGRFMLKPNHPPGIGIRCGAKWCAMFASGAVDTRAHNLPAGGGSRRLRHEIYGWFDQQFLAVSHAAPPVNLKATIRASIVAHEMLGMYALNSFMTDTLPVAFVYVRGPVKGTKYDTVWKFTKMGADSANSNLISLHMRSDSTWLVFVNGVHNPRLKASRVSHAGFFVPGVARWKWHDKDEQVWVRCGEGCCSVEDTGIS